MRGRDRSARLQEVYSAPANTPLGAFCGSCSVMGEFSIQISSDLLNRLSDDTKKLKMKTKKSKTKVPQEPRQRSAKSWMQFDLSFKMVRGFWTVYRRRRKIWRRK
nr:hypothetical protein CFP56_58002 [Quercus suber]